MLSKQDNELLARIGPGSLMGNLFREHWVPGALSSELPEPDGAPMRLRLLGEDLLAFRTTGGSVGVIQNSCPHRGASLFFGRNEEDGLRCVYHGWKFDVSGACIDMPNEPAESNFKHKIRATAYPGVERNGLLWVYMGPRSAPPPLPDLEPNMLPDGEWVVRAYQRECNWMQGLEGDVDTCHVSFLHLGGISAAQAPAGTWARFALQEKAPRYEVIDTDSGTMYGTYRPAGPDNYYWRIGNFVFPCYAFTPTGVLGLEVRFQAWVPMDDDHTLVISTGPRARAMQASAGPWQFAPTDVVPTTSDWLGRFRTVGNKENDYQIDRAAQKRDSFTGIASIFVQDHAVTESMGAIGRRDREHLGTSDMMIIQTRRRLLNAAKALAEQGIVPPTVDNPAVYGLRSGGVVLPRAAHWVEQTKHLRQAFVHHPELSRDVLGGIPAI